MSERGDGAAQPDGAASLLARLAELRSQGAWRLDPVRFHYLEALSRRLARQPEPVRRRLLAKLRAGLDDYAVRGATARLALADGGALPAAAPPSGAAFAALAQLNRYIHAAARPGPTDPAAAAAPGEPRELASVRRFRRAWSNGRSQDQVAHAGFRKPTQAGPLNSHALVLQSLESMGELSPDYLRRFLTHVESLQWLDQASAKYPPQAGKQAKAAGPVRPKRPRKQA